MAQRSSIYTLPEEVRHELERKLTDSGFAGYSELADWLNDQGYEISRSAVHRYGQKIEKRFASIKASTEAARIIAEGAADEGDTRSEAVLAMLQTELFDAMVAIGEIDDEELNPIERFGMMTHAAKNIAALASASTRLKQFQSTVRQRAEAAAEEVAKVVSKGGLSDEAADEIRRQILGISA